MAVNESTCCPHEETFVRSWLIGTTLAEEYAALASIRPMTIRSRIDALSCPRATITATTARHAATEIEPTTWVASTTSLMTSMVPEQLWHDTVMPLSPKRVPHGDDGGASVPCSTTHSPHPAESIAQSATRTAHSGSDGQPYTMLESARCVVVLTLTAAQLAVRLPRAIITGSRALSSSAAMHPAHAASCPQRSLQKAHCTADRPRQK
mmetsp:Transcript_32696/g.85600  ORF Transcript_32696/g.85600 Transcript_32696/m.85600 type:complete len:208 (-) Transcript_32696:452-1075(-)